MFKNKKFKNKIKNKHGFELSANFIVMLVLSISALSLGMYFAKNVFKTSDDITRMPLSTFDSQLETMSCDSTQPVCIGNNRKEVAVGRHVVYTLIINNQFNKERNFSIYVNVSNGFLKNHEEITSEDDLSKLRIAKRGFVKINAYSYDKIPIAVQPRLGSKHGVYNILVNVTYFNDSGIENQYGVEYLYLDVNK